MAFIFVEKNLCRFVYAELDGDLWFTKPADRMGTSKLWQDPKVELCFLMIFLSKSERRCDYHEQRILCLFDGDEDEGIIRHLFQPYASNVIGISMDQFPRNTFYSISIMVWRLFLYCIWRLFLYCSIHTIKINAFPCFLLSSILYYIGQRCIQQTGTKCWRPLLELWFNN